MTGKHAATGEAQIIQLFKTEKPSNADSAFWEWGQTYVDGGILNLLAIVEDLNQAGDEGEFRAAASELKAEVESWPDFD